jgi:hypothetical protein
MIKLSLSVDQTLMIETPGVTLRGAQPILNGVPLESWMCELIRSDNEQIKLRYTSAALGIGAFGVQATHAEAHGYVWLSY